MRRRPDEARLVLYEQERLGPSVGYFLQLLAGVGWSSLPALPLIRQPTLILAGNDDPIIPLVNARIMRSAAPQRLAPRLRRRPPRADHRRRRARPSRLAVPDLSQQRERLVEQLTIRHPRSARAAQGERARSTERRAVPRLGRRQPAFASPASRRGRLDEPARAAVHPAADPNPGRIRRSDHLPGECPDHGPTAPDATLQVYDDGHLELVTQAHELAPVVTDFLLS